RLSGHVRCRRVSCSDEVMAEDERRLEPVVTLWRDRLGRWAIRSLQIVLVLALLRVLTMVLVEVSIVMIPLIIALIIASAAAPLIGWLRRHRFPPLLAAWTTLLTALLVVGGLVTSLVVTVRSQWTELAGAARAGYEQLEGAILNLPPPLPALDW